MNATQTVLKFRVLGITDSVQVCDCCGKKDLKCTVEMEPTDGEASLYFGRTCAARAAGWTVKVLNQAVKDADLAKIQAKQEAESQRFAAYCAWLKQTYNVAQPGDLFAKNIRPRDALKLYRETTGLDP
jgi:hypothetical protein